MKSKITIDVAGITGAGKSQIRAIISNALMDHEWVARNRTREGIEFTKGDKTVVLKETQTEQTA